MSNAAKPDPRIVEYLLGKLPAPDQDRLEQQFLADDGRYEEVLAVEDELLLEYARGELSPDDRLRVEQRLIRTDRDRERVEQARALGGWLDGSGRKGRIAFWRRPAIKVGLPMAAAIALALGALVAQNLSLRRQVEQADAARAAAEQALADQTARRAADREALERKLAELQRGSDQRASGEPTRPPMIVSLVLSPGLVRSAGSMPRVVLPPDATEVQLRLNLPPDVTTKRFRAALLTADGQSVWSEQVDTAGRTAVLQIPAPQLAAGDYELVLRDSTSDLAEYYFSVVRR